MVDSNLIKPVESNQNIMGLTPAKEREEKKKRQDLHKQQTPKDELIQDEIIGSDGEKITGEITENGRDKHSIDYCA